MNRTIEKRSVIILLSEATDRANSIQHDYALAYADQSPFTDHAEFRLEINQLKRQWLVEAHAISKLADRMMGIES